MNSDSLKYLYLDQLALKSGTDKASSYHHYTKIYAELFDPLKNRPINFLEIGVHKGYSIELWENYFSQANLHFIDCSFDKLEYIPQKSQLILCDQGIDTQLQEAVSQINGGLDVIIDDGGHTMNQQQTSFRILFPKLNAGGIYVIEDLHTSYFEEFQDDSPLTTVEFLKTLIDEVNFIGLMTKKMGKERSIESIQNQLNIYRKDIHSIAFYTSVCVITKH